MISSRSILGVAAVVLASSIAFIAPAYAQDLPPVVVSTQTMQGESWPVIDELPGRVAATRTAEVRPRVGGIVVARVFEQGSYMEEGDVLYQIDPAPFQVRVASSEATLARAKAVDFHPDRSG